MNKSIGWSLALSILMIVAGLIAIAVPPAAGIAATVLVGWLLLISGVVHLVFCWHRRGAGAVLWEVLVGLLYLIIGGYILAYPVAGLVSLTVALAVYLFAEAILEGILALQLRGHRGVAWLWVDAIVDLVLAIVIWRTLPVSSTWVIGTVIGFGILFTGVTRLMLSWETRRAAKIPPAAAVA